MNSTREIGNDPRKVASSRRGSPGALAAPRPSSCRLIRGQNTALQDHAVRRVVGLPHIHARKTVFERVANIGAVEYLPVLKIAASPQPNAAGADASQWTRDAGQPPSGVPAREGNLLLARGPRLGGMAARRRLLAKLRCRLRLADRLRGRSRSHARRNCSLHEVPSCRPVVQLELVLSD